MRKNARPGVLAIAILLASLACQQAPRFDVEAGLVRFTEIDGEPRAQLVEETDRIRRTVDSLEGMGFRISSSSDQPFVVQTEHFLPAIPERIGQMTFEGYAPEDAVTGMKTKPVRVIGSRYFFWGFDETDPLGEYLIDIYVDGAFLQRLQFTVVE